MSDAVQTIIVILEQLVGDGANTVSAIAAAKTAQAADEAELADLKAQVAALTTEFGALPSGDAGTPFDPTSINDAISALTDRVTALEARNVADDASAAGLPVPAPVTGTVSIVLSPDTLPDPVVGTPYTANLTASGSAALPYLFSIASGILPDGLSLGSGGAISGTPTTAGSTDVSIQAHDANNLVGVQAYTIVVDAATAPVVEPAPEAIQPAT